MPPTTEVGFWRDPRDPHDARPEPQAFVDLGWSRTADQASVLDYLRSGVLESYELGYSFCRFGCRIQRLGKGPQHGADGPAPRLCSGATTPPSSCETTPPPPPPSSSSSSSATTTTTTTKPTTATAAVAAAAQRGLGPPGATTAATPAPAAAAVFVEAGCCTLTDGTYSWPEGYAHYVSRHAVRPPEAFVAHALANLEALRRLQPGGRRGQWDPERGGVVPLPPGTADFLRDRTTLA